MASPEESRTRAAVDGYFEAVNNHDIEAALAHLAPDFTLTFSGADMTMDRAGARNALGFDAGTGGEISHEFEVFRDTVAIVRTVEQNDFLRLLDLGPLHARLTVEVNDEGLIRRMKHENIAVLGVQGLEVLEERLAPAVAWIKEHHPEDLKEIYPEGHIRYTRESGERWVELLREWRRSGGAP